MDTSYDQKHPPEQWLTVAEESEPVRPSDILLWSLVLESRFVPHVIDQGPDGVRLLTPLWAWETADREIKLFRDENCNWPPPAPLPHPDHENTLATLSLVLLLGVFHNFIGLDTFTTLDWMAAGTADSTKIAAGEWWRAITALTLHADAEHLAGNLVIGGIFIILLCRTLGTGLGWFVIVLSGTLGNLANALLHPSHLSVGASTAIFGALGALSSISITRHRGDLRKQWQTPAAAGLALLAILGTGGKNTDLGAHLFGYVAGAALGLMTEVAAPKPRRLARWVHRILGIVATLAVVAAWLAAAQYL